MLRALAALVGFSLIAAAVVATARGRADNGELSPGPELGRDGRYPVFEELELSKEQRQIWIAARRVQIADMRLALRRVSDLRRRLRSELASGSPDATTVGQCVVDLHEVRATLAAARDRFDATLDEVLTADQRTRYEALKAAYHDDRDDRVRVDRVDRVERGDRRSRVSAWSESVYTAYKQFAWT